MSLVILLTVRHNILKILVQRIFFIGRTNHLILITYWVDITVLILQEGREIYAKLD